jgi:CO dehydrogenase maturation factor
VRSVIGAMVEQWERPAVIDMEAGIEHMSRGTGQHVDTMLIVMEPYFKSMETGARISELASEMGVRHIYVVANKTRSQEDESSLEQFCRQRNLNLIGMVPEDESVEKADRLGIAMLDFDGTSPAVRQLTRITQQLRIYSESNG